MKIAAYLDQGQPQVGIVSSDLQSVLPLDMPPTLAPVALDAVQLLAPIPRPRRNIFCVGKNYHAHAKEFAGSGFDSSAQAGGDVPKVPIFFSKVPESVAAPGADILIPQGVSEAIDYEVELTVVIGQGGK